MDRPNEHDREVFDYYPFLRRLDRFVRDHLDEPLPLSCAARVVGLERKYFSALFREKTGICYTEWLRNVRVHRAMRLMRHADYRITEVGLVVGFQDLRTFERSFKRCTGLSPSEYRKAWRAQLDRARSR